VGKDEAAKLEGLIMASRMLLQALADHIRETVPEESRRPFLLKIGTAMAELIDISRAVYDEHPSLNPHPMPQRENPND
jgi:hypothetical protein